MKSHKILFILPCLLNGGTEAFAINYAKLLRTHGIFFDFYVYGRIDNSIKKTVEKLGSSVFIGSSPKLFNYNKCAEDFRIFLINNKYDIVHCNCNYDSFIFLKIAYYQKVNHRIAHSHDTQILNFLYFKSFFQNMIKRLVIRKYANHFFACSRKAGCDIFGKHFFRKRGVVIPNIIDKEKIYALSAEEVQLFKTNNFVNSHFSMGNITRFEKKKNQLFLLKVMKKLVSLDPTYTLYLGGVETDYFQKVVKATKKYNLIDNVIFIGKRDDVNQWINSFDLYLFPSLFEGFGIVLIENQTVGLRSLVSDKMQPEVVIDPSLVNIKKLKVSLWVKQIMLIRNQTKLRSSIALDNYDGDKLLNEYNKMF